MYKTLFEFQFWILMLTFKGLNKKLLFLILLHGYWLSLFTKIKECIGLNNNNKPVGSIFNKFEGFLLDVLQYHENKSGFNCFKVFLNNMFSFRFRPKSWQIFAEDGKHLRNIPLEKHLTSNVFKFSERNQLFSMFLFGASECEVCWVRVAVWLWSSGHLTGQLLT